jgi:hydroxymethylpyrimidine/phosphomethylpyrimidine kinase
MGMKVRQSIPVALTVAGSDSGGGAGIQGDLKTFHAHDVFGVSAITCVTAQNPGRVSAVQLVAPRVVAAQMDCVFEAFPVAAAKTGMLYDAGIIEVVASGFSRRKFRRLVVDPVMMATSGALLLKKGAIAVLQRRLFPQAAVVTPNCEEAAALWGREIRTLADLRAAAQALSERFGVPFLVKGGHLPVGNQVVDILCEGRVTHEFSAQVVRGIRAHGAGCTFSAAITANLALGHDLPTAVRRAKRFITRAFRNAVRVGKFRALKV